MNLFETDTEGRLFVIDVSINWPSNRHWQTKVLDSWKAARRNYFVRKVWRTYCIIQMHYSYTKSCLRVYSLFACFVVLFVCISPSFFSVSCVLSFWFSKYIFRQYLAFFFQDCQSHERERKYFKVEFSARCVLRIRVARLRDFLCQTNLSVVGCCALLSASNECNRTTLFEMSSMKIVLYRQNTLASLQNQRLRSPRWWSLLIAWQHELTTCNLSLVPEATYKVCIVPLMRDHHRSAWTSSSSYCLYILEQVRVTWSFA